MFQNCVCLEGFYTKMCVNIDNADMFKYLARHHILYVVFHVKGHTFCWP